MNEGFARYWIRRAATAFLILSASPFFGQTLPDIDTVLDRVAARFEDYHSKASWTANVTSTQIETDRKWNPEKTTVVSKAVTVTEGRREENVLKVVETVDGQTRDVTARYLAEQRERRERARARRTANPDPAPREKPGRDSRGRRGYRLDIEELLPFSADRRPDFDFRFRETKNPAGRKLILLDVAAKVKDPMNWEGTYMIDAETFDPVQARLKPSETPSMVKELEVEAEIEVLEGIYFIPKRTWIKVNAGFLFIKRIHLISEEIYSDIRITR